MVRKLGFKSLLPLFKVFWPQAKEVNMSRRREGIGYMVMRNEHPSLVGHDSEDAAIKEAERLAENTRGDYIVLRPVELIRPAPKTERYTLRPAPEGVPGSNT